MLVIDSINKSLRAKVLLAVISVVAFILTAVVAYNLITQDRHWSANTERTGFLLADTIYSAIKHPMATGAEATVEQQLKDIGAKFSDIEVYVFDFKKEISYATREDRLRQSIAKFVTNKANLDHLDELLEIGTGSQSVFKEQVEGTPSLAVITPIVNEPDCHHCHGSSRKVLGAMMVRQSTAQSIADLKRVRNWNIVVGFGGVLIVAGLLALLLSLLVSRPVSKVVNAAEVLAKGDLTSRLETDSENELGVLSDSFNSMSERFSETIEVASSAALVVSEGTTEQASSIEETSASLEQMAGMARQNAERTGEANLLIDENDKALSDANKVMKRSMASLAELVESSNQTARIIKEIDEIAFKTNLLALNAAVEAARAGEAGMGFAVVAEEVRNLAQRAADSAKTTAGLVEATIIKAKHEEELISETDAAYREVALKAQNLRQVIAAIDTASQEQAQGVEQINQAMAEIDKVVQRNTTAAEKLSTALSYFRTTDGQHIQRT